MDSLQRTIRLDRPADWDDLDDVPEDMIGEIIAGEIVMKPRPNPPHMQTASELFGRLHGPFRRAIGGPGGWRIFDEPRVRFVEDIRVPDIGGWRAERWVNVPREGPIPIIPDWICEVLSPSTEAEDRTVKLPLYARHKVGHVWLISPEARTLEVFRRTPSGWLLAAAHAGHERVRAEPFDAVELDLEPLWSDV